MQNFLIALHFNQHHMWLFIFLTSIGAITLATMGFYQWWSWLLLLGWLFAGCRYVLPRLKQSSQGFLWLITTQNQPSLSIAKDTHLSDKKNLIYDLPLKVSISPLWVYISGHFENSITQTTEKKTIFVLRSAMTELDFRALTLCLFQIQKSLRKNKKNRHV